MNKSSKLIRICLYMIVIPAIIALSVAVLKQRRYEIVAVIIALLSCTGVYLSYEHKKADVKEVVIIAVLVALSIAGRVVFAFIPGFKPVTAMVIISAIYFGPEAGFMVGSLTALVSNFYFGQGPWTPFQMFVWGVIGLVAGILAKQLRKNRIMLYIYGFFAGIIYSVLIDIWTVLWLDNSFNIKRYITAVFSSLTFMIIYSVSNIVFLAFLEKPIGRKIDRLIKKYGLKGVETDK